MTESRGPIERAKQTSQDQCTEWASFFVKTIRSMFTRSLDVIKFTLVYLLFIVIQDRSLRHFCSEPRANLSISTAWQFADCNRLARL